MERCHEFLRTAGGHSSILSPFLGLSRSFHRFEELGVLFFVAAEIQVALDLLADSG